EEQYKSLPYLAGVEENRLRSAEGQVAYVRGSNFAPGDRASIVRPTLRSGVMPLAPGKLPDRDPILRRDAWNRAEGLENKGNSIRWAQHFITNKRFDFLGWEVVEVAQGHITREGDPSTLLVAPGGHEVRKGDLLMPYDAFPY